MLRAAFHPIFQEKQYLSYSQETLEMPQSSGLALPFDLSETGTDFLSSSLFRGFRSTDYRGRHQLEYFVNLNLAWRFQPLGEGWSNRGNIKPSGRL